MGCQASKDEKGALNLLRLNSVSRRRSALKIVTRRLDVIVAREAILLLSQREKNNSDLYKRASIPYLALRNRCLTKAMQYCCLGRLILSSGHGCLSVNDR